MAQLSSLESDWTAIALSVALFIHHSMVLIVPASVALHALAATLVIVPVSFVPSASVLMGWIYRGTGKQSLLWSRCSVSVAPQLTLSLDEDVAGNTLKKC